MKKECLRDKSFLSEITNKLNKKEITSTVFATIANTFYVTYFSILLFDGFDPVPGDPLVEPAIEPVVVDVVLVLLARVVQTTVDHFRRMPRTVDAKSKYLK